MTSISTTVELMFAGGVRVQPVFGHFYHKSEEYIGKNRWLVVYQLYVC